MCPEPELRGIRQSYNRTPTSSTPCTGSPTRTRNIIVQAYIDLISSCGTGSTIIAIARIGKNSIIRSIFGFNEVTIGIDNINNLIFLIQYRCSNITPQSNSTTICNKIILNCTMRSISYSNSGTQYRSRRTMSCRCCAFCTSCSSN